MRPPAQEDDLTVFILTCNRHQLLIRTISYWRATSVVVHIIDGSSKHFGNAELIPPNIFYHHFPAFPSESVQSNYARRMRFGASLAKSKYSALCGDDDFFTHSGIIRSLEILDSNDEIDLVMRPCLYYEEMDDGLRWTLEYGAWIPNGYESSKNLVDRLTRSERILLTYYGICRTDIWVSILNLSFERVYSHKFANEFLMCELGRAMLRIQVLNEVLWIRELNNAEKYRDDLSTFRQWLRSRDNSHEIAHLEIQLQLGIGSLCATARQMNSAIATRLIMNYHRSYRLMISQIIGRALVSAGRVLSPVHRLRINQLLPRWLSTELGFRGTALIKNRQKLDDLFEYLKKSEIGYSETDLREFENLMTENTD